MTLKSGIYDWKDTFQALGNGYFSEIAYAGWYRVFAVGSPAQRGNR